jgi:hypothetical protein
LGPFASEDNIHQPWANGKDRFMMYSKKIGVLLNIEFDEKYD